MTNTSVILSSTVRILLFYTNLNVELFSCDIQDSFFFFFFY